MFRYTRPVTNWIEALEEIKQLREEYHKNAQVMTPYERQAAEGYISDRRRANRDSIARGTVQSFNIAVATCESAKKRIEDERRKEITRWDAGKLTAEMQLIQMRVNAIMTRNNLSYDDPSPELRALFTEAQESGDPHRLRAAAEILAADPPGARAKDNLDIQLRINHVTHEAQRALEEIRVTPGMTEAERARETAENELLNLHQGLDRTAQIMGYRDAMGAHGPLSSAYERLRRDKSGALVIEPDKERTEWVEEFFERMEI